MDKNFSVVEILLEVLKTSRETLLLWVKPCTSDTEPGAVEEKIRTKLKNHPELKMI